MHWQSLFRSCRASARGIERRPEITTRSIECQSGDPEAHRLANDIGQVLSQAAVRNLSLTPNAYPFLSMYGLFAAHHAALDVSWLTGAFADAGMPILPMPQDLTQHRLTVNALPPNLYLFVGIKPWLSSLENEADDADNPQSESCCRRGLQHRYPTAIPSPKARGSLVIGKG